MAKNWIINTDLCDLRKAAEETLRAYERIVINADLVLVNERVRGLLATCPIIINCDDVLDCDEDVQLRTVNGPCEIRLTGIPETKQLLTVNGPLVIDADAGPALKQYVSISVNGQVQCPRSLLGALGNLHVNGSVQSYPDGAIRLKSTAVVDHLFVLRAKQALYWAGRRIVMVDPKLDAGALAAKGAAFSSKEAILAASLAETLAPLFDDETELIIVPDGAAVVRDDLTLNNAALRRYGSKLYIIGDLTLTEESRAALGQLEYLHVSGDVSLPKSLEEAFAGLDAEYGKLNIIKGRSIHGLPFATISRRMLETEEDGVLVNGCAAVLLASDIAPELILEKLTLNGCAAVTCTKEQESAVAAIATGVGFIGKPEDKVQGLLDTKFTNTDQYVM